MDWRTAEKREKTAQRTFVQPINPDEYRVVGGELEGTVNLSTKSCTCRKFDMDQYPCVHGMAACLYRHIKFHHMCKHYYYASTLCTAYAESIYLVGDVMQWEVPNDVQMMVVLPSDNRRRAVGRPRKKRILSQGEDKKRYKCGRCKQVGHNRAWCTELIAHENDVSTSSGGHWQFVISIQYVVFSFFLFTTFILS